VRICRVTHPFHPRHGEELEYFEYRHDWCGQRVYFDDGRGCLTSMPAEWTSVVAADACQLISEGRARFRLDDLLRLLEVIAGARAAQRALGGKP
jgi:hypothetical protein